MSSINGLGASYTYTSQKAEKSQEAEAQTKAAAKAEEQQKETAKTEAEDKVVKSDKTDAGVYTKPTISRLTSDDLLEIQRQRMESFTQMLQSMVVRQGQQSNLKLFGQDLSVSAQKSSDAAASIAEGGEYSVESVAGRILDMAKSLAGGDESKIGLLRAAVEKGFKAAGVSLGGKLPSISQRTYEAVQKGFDEWEKTFETKDEAAAEKAE